MPAHHERKLQVTTDESVLVSSEPAAVPRRTTRTIAATAVGTAMEMYDFVLYGTAAALVFGPLFFPQVDPIIGTLASLATFGVGFAARPLGGVIFGNLGDRIGRKRVLVITMMGMGVFSTVIGLLPTYQSIGLWAPILLVVLRLLQGVAMGGEQGGAFVMAAESGGQRSTRRGFLGAWPAVGMAGGLVLATLIFGAFAGALDEDAFLSWGWRVPFLISLVLVGIGLAVRLGVPETSVFEAVKSQNRTDDRGDSKLLATDSAGDRDEVRRDRGVFPHRDVLGFLRKSVPRHCAGRYLERCSCCRRRRDFLRSTLGRTV